MQVGHGETVTVRVPTHDEGTALFWEFSTDSYDIAFGLFFEWNKAPEETEVSVHVSDSEDEDVDDEYLGETEGVKLSLLLIRRLNMPCDVINEGNYRVTDKPRPRGEVILGETPIYVSQSLPSIIFNSL